MSLLLAPFPNNDPLAIAQLARAGIGDFQRNLAMGTEMAQRRAETQMKLQAQVLGDIQDSLWKKREADRREQADAFNMQMELRKLDLLEEDQKYKREHALDRYDPLLNPEAAARIAAHNARTEKYQSEILTPEEREMQTREQQAELRKKEADAIEAERNTRFLQAATENEQSTQFLNEINATDATVGPMTEEMSKTFRMAESLKKESAGNMKSFAPIPKPGVVPAPKPEKPPTVYERKQIMEIDFGEMTRRVEGMEKQIDEAKRVHREVTKRLEDARGDTMSLTDEGKKNIARLEKEAASAAKATVRSLTGEPAEIDVNRAEDWLTQQRAELARRKSQALKNQPPPSGDANKGNLTLDAPQTESVGSARNPLLPLPKTLDAIGLDPAQKTLFNQFFTAQPAP
jgi:DNA-binding MarR family transcriptional regulator